MCLRPWTCGGRGRRPGRLLQCSIFGLWEGGLPPFPAPLPHQATPGLRDTGVKGTSQADWIFLSPLWIYRQPEQLCWTYFPRYWAIYTLLRHFKPVVYGRSVSCCSIMNSKLYMYILKLKYAPKNILTWRGEDIPLLREPSTVSTQSQTIFWSAFVFLCVINMQNNLTGHRGQLSTIIMFLWVLQNCGF